MKITKEEVEHVAHLARLHLDEKELEQMTAQLDTILSYVEKLQELDTSGVVPTTHAFSISNAFREDCVQPSLTQQEALAEGPKTNQESFIVPRVI
ncbi:MAG: Asp-tRNA(Asn)/Glu-tRNA(Gln) amidotransferase subunit GatC [Desulfocapsaceae bacterium]|jgi:aspartyl-tRNA(Asn)/glutamyl-tRNA(Gln) amidotransferase subunit C|nr:Asp-tRNA(Asn)/Glu-tRNA(Gln) amidotransferase subunit GatC [Desulfocapsaceae bacterium]